MGNNLEITKLEQNIKDFYSKSFSVNDIDDSSYLRVDTPFFDRHNDSLIIYAKKIGDQYIITDGGYILDDLETDGIYISRSKKRKAILKSQINSYSVQLNEENNELFVINKNIEDFAQSQNLLIQAMLFVNDMFVLSSNTVGEIFKSDVERFFEENNIRTFEDPNFVGTSGMTHKFDFSIAGLRRKDIPDKLIKVMNSPRNEYYAKALATDVRLTKPVLKNTTNFYIIINDSKDDIDSKIINLFNSENITPIPFSERNDFVEELAE
ncbi:DUF1828 domain-containing protein [Companilactobacillus sp.]|jgi:hypothetical protein|uniref:DUF1828 domain-containing protein n=1 Tax=Companilactobacillus sp. TaxID=2767905 RepID=UPI0025C2DE8B|nr:DUF1828 domain-containing protein [Companilactobacillus sp.]MCH4009661.1 DUF1829 domain-containing protein [Companilactobacillus sp.]MCH4052663.1 DUF1829 domain-containing protein [Companilactobacillus sp.]MCH4077603.1 DUF1829 domain-containing protein [Companilactobacillus sp.]MCH4126179.1 DUF1829 domain-containing protein [Companilactobacillus sp.]MCI1311887.1 DUF1829 domain-containing protein [Companilactobacillus sp.]